MDWINRWDHALMGFIQGNLHTPAGDTVFPWVTYLGEAGFLWLLLALFFLCRKKLRSRGTAMVLAIVLGFVAGELILKNLVCRPRPFQAGDFPAIPLLISPPGGYSFPSGHACSSFAAAAALCCFSRKWGVPALVLAGLIAFSRVYLFVHWPTDVLTGALLGVCFGLLSCRLLRCWRQRPHKDTEQG